MGVLAAVAGMAAVAAVEPAEVVAAGKVAAARVAVVGPAAVAVVTVHRRARGAVTPSVAPQGHSGGRRVIVAPRRTSEWPRG